MSLNAADLARKIMDSDSEFNSLLMNTEGKIDPSKITSSISTLSWMMKGEAIKEYIQENIEILYSWNGISSFPPAPDPVTSATGQIISWPGQLAPNPAGFDAAIDLMFSTAICKVNTSDSLLSVPNVPAFNPDWKVELTGTIESKVAAAIQLLLQEMESNLAIISSLSNVESMSEEQKMQITAASDEIKAIGANIYTTSQQVLAETIITMLKSPSALYPTPILGSHLVFSAPPGVGAMMIQVS